MQKILVVEDDPAIQALLHDFIPVSYTHLSGKAMWFRLAWQVKM